MSKILIVDDHPLMRKGLALSLNAETDLTVCGQAANAEEALSVLEELDPDLAIVDISLPGMGGLELIKHMQALRPEMRTLVVSRHDEALYAERAIRARRTRLRDEARSGRADRQGRPARAGRRHLR